MSGRFRFSIVAVLALVLLRVAIGWHFLYEGMWKYSHASFTAEPFLKQSRGPFASFYRNLIPDYFGTERLNYERMTARWGDLKNRYAVRFGFTDEQRQAADAALARRSRQLNELLREERQDPKTKKQVFVDNAEVRQYLASLKAWREKENLAVSQDIPYERQRQFDKWQEIQREIAPLLADVDKADDGFTSNLESIVTQSQREALAATALGFKPSWLVLAIGAAAWLVISFILFYLACWVNRQSPPGLVKSLGLVLGANLVSVAVTLGLAGIAAWMLGNQNLLDQFDVRTALGVLALLLNFGLFVGLGGRLYERQIPSERGPRIAAVQGVLQLALALGALVAMWLRLVDAHPHQWTRLEILEAMTTYGLIAIGLCLMVGLFTRLAALGGAIFLLTAVILAQVSWPGYLPQLPPSAGHSLIINKEVIEMLVLFALASTSVGRWGGLDFFVHHLVTLPVAGKGRDHA